MDVKIILDTAKQFLVTPPGQKLLKKINIEQVDKVIENLVTKLGGSVKKVKEEFNPEGGAYGLGRTHGHKH